jgi:hypothetical protein
MRSVTDAEIVGWVSRLGAVGSEHVAAWFEIEQDEARQRLVHLEQGRLLGCAKRQDDSRVLYWASRTGLSECGFQHLGVWDGGAFSIEDTLHVAQAAVELMRGLPDWQVLSAREIAAIEAVSGEPFASVQVSGEGRWKTHRPTFVLCSPSARVVPVEVHPGMASVSSLRATCRGWARARDVGRVYWLAHYTPSLAVRRAVHEARASERIMVLDLRDISLLLASECAREEASDVLC